MKKITIILLTVFLFIQGTAFILCSPDGLLDDLRKKLENYTSSYRQEKIYIQLDKPFYKPGDITWFNIVVLDAKTHLPTGKSDVVYAELIDPKGSSVKKLELPLYQGTAKGDFDLPEFEGGLFKIKAYTNWSRNFPKAYLIEREVQVQNTITTRLLFKPDFDRESYGKGESGVFELEIKDLQNNPASRAKVNYSILLQGKEISGNEIVADSRGKAFIHFNLPEDLSSVDLLINARVSFNGIEESISRAIPVQLNQLSLFFFPEGGSVIPGEKNRIAFQALNEYSDETDVAGVISDEEGNEITGFQSLHMGMGAFEINMSPGKKYYAQITSPAGTGKKFALPQDDFPAGLTLVSRDHGRLEFRIKGELEDPVLLGHCRGNLVFEQAFGSGRSLKIDTRDFPSGICVFTLFDGSGIPLAERLVYLNKQKLMKVSLETDKMKYEPGEKVKLSIRTKDPEGKAQSMKLALSVVDDQLLSFADIKDENILSYFLLSSELEGEVKGPAFYFDEEEEKADEALDLLLMTRGWRAFSWDNVLKNEADSLFYAPEILSVVTGRLQNMEGEAVRDFIYAYETGGERRIIKVRTNEDGQFLIRNFNPEYSLHLVCSRPNIIVVNDERAIRVFGTSNTIRWGYREYNQMYQQNYSSAYQWVDVTNQAEGLAEDGFDFSLESDNLALNEVVVTGYGVSSKQELSSSVVVVRGVSTIHEYPSVASLQGKMAGFVVTSSSAVSQPMNISFSKARSLVSGDHIPLVVYNGFLLSSPLSRHFLHSEMFSPDMINSLTYMDSPEARKDYGSKASNGIIFIDSKSKIIPDVYEYKTKNGKYNGIIITTRKFAFVRQGYELAETMGKKERNRLGHMVYWNPEIVTDEKGEAEIEFVTNDAISTFRLTAEGISPDGQLGRQETSYSSILPLSLDIKLPVEIGFEDSIRAKLLITNNTDDLLEGKIYAKSEGLNIAYTESFSVQPHISSSVPLTITSLKRSGEHKLVISVGSGKFHDRLEETVKVNPIGFPVYRSFSGQNPNDTIRVKISDVEEGSLGAELMFYPDMINELESMAEALFKAPHGCFEQVSSTTYPSILALQYLNSTNSGSNDSRERALDYIRSGYRQLAAYEVEGGGFEWFGHAPAHEGLTAFGLVEFTEMKKVYGGVDDKMIKRTEKWLLSRKDGEGGFKQNNGKYGFSAASFEVNNAYIVYALSETGVRDIELEYNTALQECLKSRDLYRMALIAIAAFNRNDLENYRKLLDHFYALVGKSGLQAINADHSLVRSYGNNLRTEVLSLWIIAILKSHDANLGQVSGYIDYILKQRKYNGFGSTQGTTLALQAISSYNRTKSVKFSNGKIQLRINDRYVDSVYYSSRNSNAVSMTDFASFLMKNRENQVVLKYPDPEVKLPYTFTVHWMNKSPESIPDAPLVLTTGLLDKDVKLNETARLIVRLENRKQNGLPMCIARIGIPGGLSLQPWQLKDYQEKGLFDYYEIIDEDLVLYYTEMGPAQVIELPFDLKADIAGRYKGKASTGYIYYNDEEKSWSKGLEVLIRE